MKAGDAALLKEEQAGRCQALPVPNDMGHSPRHRRAPPEWVGGFGRGLFWPSLGKSEPFDEEGNSGELYVQAGLLPACACLWGFPCMGWSAYPAMPEDIPSGDTQPRHRQTAGAPFSGAGGRGRQLGWIWILIASLVFPACLPAGRG